jgi:hypothetical protein
MMSVSPVSAGFNSKKKTGKKVLKALPSAIIIDKNKPDVDDLIGGCQDPDQEKKILAEIEKEDSLEREAIKEMADCPSPSLSRLSRSNNLKPIVIKDGGENEPAFKRLDSSLILSLKVNG